jgi:hypothetical protein
LIKWSKIGYVFYLNRKIERTNDDDTYPIQELVYEEELDCGDLLLLNTIVDNMVGDTLNRTIADIWFPETLTRRGKKYYLRLTKCGDNIVY